MGLQWEIIVESLPLYWSGLSLTLQLVSIALVCGMALALPISILLVYRVPLLSPILDGWVYFFRSTPLLVQLLVVYYGLGQMDWMQQQWEAGNVFWLLFREPYFCACFTFSLNTSAYTAQMLAGAIRQTPIAEIEAAKALGMSWQLRMRRIILPSTLRRTLQSYSNEVVLMLQGSAIASAVTLVDVTGAGRVVYSKYYAPFEAFIFTGLIYLVLTFGLLGLFKLAERRFLAHLRPRS